MPGPGDIYKNEKTFLKSFKRHETWDFKYSKRELVELTKFWRKPGSFHINKSRTTITYHLQKLLDADLIKEVKVDRVTKYKLKDEDMIISFLIKHKDELSIESVDLRLKWLRHQYIGGLENILEIGWEIFPHPYYC